MDSFTQSSDGENQEKRQNASKRMRVKLPIFGRKSSVNDVGDDGGSGGREYGSKGVESSRLAKPQKSPRSLYSRGSREDLVGYSDRSDGVDYVESATPKFSQSSSLFGSGASSISSKFFRESSNDNSTQGTSLQVRGSDVDYAQEDDVNKKVRVKPYSAFPSGTYMNEIELYQCMMAGSSRFEFLTSYLDPSTKLTRRAKVPDIVRRQFGSPKEDGRIGSLRIEILGCVGLDRAKPEVSVYAVCGDCAFTTDIIDGNRSPMWPNSSKRAAVFPLHHAYARAFIGVFDVKQQKEREADHLCGRVAIDVPSLRPDTEYDITFPLRVSSFIYDRRPRGVVRVRFSIHFFSERSAILSYLKRPRNPLAFSKQASSISSIFSRESSSGNLIRLDCMLYERPLISFYLLSTSMHCVYSVRLGQEVSNNPMWRPKNISQCCCHSPWTRLSRKIHAWSVSSYNERIQFITAKHPVRHESIGSRLYIVRAAFDLVLSSFNVNVLRLS